MVPDTELVDATFDNRYESFLYRCLAPAPFRKYRQRREYLEAAIPKGFRKKLLIFRGEIVGQIEYAPSEGSGYPIRGRGIIVMNCIWVLRRAKGHRFGMRLFEEMMKTDPSVAGFATLGLEGHWSPWLRRDQLEKLSFKSIDSLRVSHKTKHVGDPSLCISCGFQSVQMRNLRLGTRGSSLKVCPSVWLIRSTIRRPTSRRRSCRK